MKKLSRWFSKLSFTARVMCAIEGLLFALLLAVGIAVYFIIYPFERPGAYAAGLFLGCALSAIKIVLLEKTLVKAMDLGKHAKTFASLHAIVRYFGTIAAVIPAFIFPRAIGVFGVVAGLLSLQITAFITPAFLKKEKSSLTAVISEKNSEQASNSAASPNSEPATDSATGSKLLSDSTSDSDLNSDSAPIPSSDSSSDSDPDSDSDYDDFSSLWS